MDNLNTTPAANETGLTGVTSPKSNVAPAKAKGKAKAAAKAKAEAPAKRKSRLTEGGEKSPYATVLNALKAGPVTVATLAARAKIVDRDVRLIIDRARARKYDIVRTSKNTFGYAKGFKVPATHTA